MMTHLATGKKGAAFLRLKYSTKWLRPRLLSQTLETT